MQKYRGRGVRCTALLEQIIAILAERQPMTVRGVCYALFVIGALASMERNATNRIGWLLLQARERKEVPWEWIVDETRAMERPRVWQNLGQFARVVQRSYQRDLWQTQPYQIQLWSEKSTVAGVVRPLLKEYRIPFMSVHGFASGTAINDAAEASAEDEREVVMLYIGDHDPSGMCMSEKDIPKRLIKYNGQVTVQRIAVVKDDHSRLPSFPAKQIREGKKLNANLPWYQQRYGDKAWELDAMNPNELRARVETAIRSYIDFDEWDRQLALEAEEQQQVDEWAATLAKAK